uniref:Uncharacterized protein n=1 Tax=Naja naja TaxID=35670 RepID=A0A8C6Y8X5_NAJNA
MSLPSGNLEDAAKQRPKDSKMRREELDNPQPEGKRLKLGNEEGHLRKEGADDWEKSHLGREESGTQTDGEGQTVSRRCFCSGHRRKAFGKDFLPCHFDREESGVSHRGTFFREMTLKKGGKSHGGVVGLGEINISMTKLVHVRTRWERK